MSTTEPGTVKAPRRLLALVAAAALAVGSAGYLWTGEPKLALNPPVAAAAHAPLESQEMVALVERLAERLKQSPDDANGWAMLGRSYLVLGRAPEAIPAYQQALKLRPDDPKLLTDYAGALAMVAGQRMTAEALALVERALKIEPDNLKALSLAGSAAYDRQDWAGAVKYWERIIAAAPPGSDFIAQVQAGIDDARERGGLAQAAPAPKTPAAAAGATVSGRVTLAAALRGQVAPEDTVFVFARAAEGPRMPLAIVRKQAKDLPFDFTLDDSTAMSPAMKLSAFPRVVVGARVSKTGDATPRPGDLTGLSDPVAPGARGVQLEISQVTKP